MKAELVAERVVDLPVGAVRCTLARHDDGHYSGVATLVATGQRIGMIAGGPALNGVVQPGLVQVDATVAGQEVVTLMERLLADTIAAESGHSHLAPGADVAQAADIAI